MASHAENVSIWWRHHELLEFVVAVNISMPEQNDTHFVVNILKSIFAKENFCILVSNSTAKISVLIQKWWFSTDEVSISSLTWYGVTGTHHVNFNFQLLLPYSARIGPTPAVCAPSRLRYGPLQHVTVNLGLLSKTQSIWTSVVEFTNKV